MFDVPRALVSLPVGLIKNIRERESMQLACRRKPKEDLIRPTFSYFSRDSAGLGFHFAVFYCNLELAINFLKMDLDPDVGEPRPATTRSGPRFPPNFPPPR